MTTEQEQLNKLLKDLGGKKCNTFTIKWRWLELPSEVAAAKVVAFLTELGGCWPRHEPGWRPGDEGKHFVTYHV